MPQWLAIGSAIEEIGLVLECSQLERMAEPRRSPASEVKGEVCSNTARRARAITDVTGERQSGQSPASDMVVSRRQQSRRGRPKVDDVAQSSPQAARGHRNAPSTSSRCESGVRISPLVVLRTPRSPEFSGAGEGI